MKHERMKVLDLLDAGKITAEEATKLLEAMKRPAFEERAFVFDEDVAQNVEEKVHRFTKSVDTFTKEFGGKVGTLYKDVEPKIKKASQAILEKTAVILDEISKSLNDTLENVRGQMEEECCCCCESEAAENDCCGEPASNGEKCGDEPVSNGEKCCCDSSEEDNA